MNYDNLERICKENGTNPTALSTKLGLSKGNTSSWRKGGNPSVEVLIRLADELHCSVDSLLGRPEHPELPKDDQCLLEAYHKADSAAKRDVRKLLDLPVNYRERFINALRYANTCEKDILNIVLPSFANNVFLNHINKNIPPDMATIKKVAETLNISLDYLLGNSEEMIPNGTSEKQSEKCGDE